MTLQPQREGNPKVSVAMLAYNHERFLAQALGSVLAQQTNFEYEVIVGEDCSKDSTRAILSDFCERHPGRIVPLFQKRNIGMSGNLKAILEECRGQYIAFIEGDDYWLDPQKLQKQADFLDWHADHAICCHRVELHDEITSALEGRVIPARSFRAGSYSIEDLITENVIPNLSAVMYRSDSVGPFADWLLELEFCDWPMHILAARGGKIGLMDEVMSRYRLHGASLFSSRSGVNQKQPLIPMLIELDKRLNFEHSNTIARKVAACYFDMAICERLNGNRAATRKYLFDSMRGGNLPLGGRWRALGALLAYSLLGFRRAKSLSAAARS